MSRPSKPAESPARQLAGFIRRFDPAIATLVRSARAALRKRLPTAIELVYDNYNALAIGFATTERASDAIVSIAVYARGVNLYFIYGATLRALGIALIALGVLLWSWWFGPYGPRPASTWGQEDLFSWIQSGLQAHCPKISTLCPTEEALRIAREIAEGLEEAHGSGILHRDLKPSNVMVTTKGVAKLLDFGLATLVSVDADVTRTLDGTVLGTAAVYHRPHRSERARELLYGTDRCRY